MTEYKDGMLQKCRDVVKKEQHFLEQQLECDTYAETLRLMERRLWDAQITHKRTMASYEQALKLQKFECADLEQDAKFAESQRKHAENSFNALLKRQENDLRQTRETTVSLRVNKAERDALMAEYNDLIFE